MQPFGETAYYLLAWRAFLVALIVVVLLVSVSFEPVVTCLIGANVALLFSLGLIAWNSRLDDERVIRTEAWHLLPPEQRPAGQAGRRWARSIWGGPVVCQRAGHGGDCSLPQRCDIRRVTPGSSSFIILTTGVNVCTWRECEVPVPANVCS
jgi:hypothetical protein